MLRLLDEPTSTWWRSSRGVPGGATMVSIRKMHGRVPPCWWWSLCWLRWWTRSPRSSRLRLQSPRVDWRAWVPVHTILVRSRLTAQGSDALIRLARAFQSRSGV